MSKKDQMSIKQLEDAATGKFLSVADRAAYRAGLTRTGAVSADLSLPAPTRELARKVEDWATVGRSYKSRMPPAAWQALLESMELGVTLSLDAPKPDCTSTLRAQGLDPKLAGISNVEELRELRRKRTGE